MDIAWLGLERHGEGRWSFELTPGLTRFDGKLYGGTGIATTVATMEAETGRGAVYAVVQFVGSADIGERIDCHVEVMASGRKTSQVRMTATVGERVVLAALGAAGESSAEHALAQFGTMPDVEGPEECGPWIPNIPRFANLDNLPFKFPPEEGSSWLALSDVRRPETDVPGQAMWVRMNDMNQTRATLGFLADMVPSSVTAAAGKIGGGVSLDNSMRFGPPPDTEWMLVDMDPYLMTEGYVHGAARLWSPDGTLLGVASQTATLKVME